MHQPDRAAEALVGEVGEEVAELVGGEHPLVDEGARRQRREVQLDVAVSRPALGDLAQAEGAPLELEAALAGGAATNSCRNAGMTRWAVGPSPAGSVGTSRQPRTTSPSSAATCSTSATAVGRRSASTGRKAMPTA